MFILSLENLFFISFFIFCIGSLGLVLNFRSVILTLIALELMLLSASTNLIFLSCWMDDLIGFLFCILVITVAAAESSIGLAILVSFFRVHHTIKVEVISGVQV